MNYISHLATCNKNRCFLHFDVLGNPQNNLLHCTHDLHEVRTIGNVSVSGSTFIRTYIRMPICFFTFCVNAQTFSGCFFLHHKHH